MSESALDVDMCAQQLEATLNKEATLYKELLEFARELERATQREDADATRELMARRNDLLGKLESVSGVTDRLRRNLAGYDDLPEQTRARVSEALGRTSAVLEELLRVERETERPLGALKDSIQRELSEVGRGRRLLEKYRSERQMEPQFMDKRQ